MPAHWLLTAFHASRLAAVEGGSAVRDLIWPPVCRWCREPVAAPHDFCNRCLTALAVTESAMERACRQCGFPKPPRREEVRELPCAECVHHRFTFDGVVPLWAYQDRVCDAVVAAKYAHAAPLGRALGLRLGRRVAASLQAAPGPAAEDRPEAVTFVPSPLSRRLVRGGLGIEPVAEAVAEALGVRCRSLLRMTRRIAKQAWLDDRGRIDNVRGAFALKRGYPFRRSRGINGLHLLVVDDVLTTGATANEVARVLKAGGARRVSLAVLARTIRRS